MMEKNILPKHANYEYLSGKNDTTFKVGCFLHPHDVEEIQDLIEKYVKNHAIHSRDFSENFNLELEEREKYLENHKEES